MTFDYQLIVAHSYPEYGIGKKNNLPWRLKNELKYFSQLTTNTLHTNYNKCDTDNNSETEINYINAVVMGRKTYDALPSSFKPLPNRLNIIITHNKDLHTRSCLLDNLLYCTWDNLNYTLQNTNTKYKNMTNNEKTQKYQQIYKVFIIGGNAIYQKALDTLPLSQVHITEVYLNEKKDMDSFDTFFPKYDPHNWLVQSTELDTKEQLHLERVSPYQYENNIYYRYLTYMTSKEMSNIISGPYLSPEYQYLDIMRNIMNGGLERNDRTGTGTLSIFGTQQKYDLTDTFPISTTKRIFFRAVFEELSLYLSGKTDNKILHDKNIHIWDGNTSREFLDKRGLTEYPEGDMGETYGFNFRHFGGKYKDCHTEYPLTGNENIDTNSENGYDQIANVLHLLKTDPTSRRIIINLWNPATTHKASLPSCLMMYQFYVNTQAKKLNCQIYLRSSDYFLANNWNTCTGALLTHLICSLEDIDLTPGELTVVTGDTHLYKTHLEQVNENLVRKPFPFCKLVVKKQKKQLTDFTYEDLRLVGYRTHKNIPAPMAV